MSNLDKPSSRPSRPYFSSGPCAKRPGWSPQVLEAALLGRSHRSAAGKERLKLAIDLTHDLLELPVDYRVGIVPGSDTGAFEMALWSMLGARGVDVLAWEDFGKRWVGDIVGELKLPDTRLLEADYGYLPDLASVDFDRDVIFTWNGTAAGVRVPDGKWIAGDRHGLTFVDATSALFAQKIDWRKVDVATFSWQKVLGGEAAHGMLILSPRAVERLTEHRPVWPVPKLFRLANNGRIDEGIFSGVTINTPSMLCVEDYLDTLRWAQNVGGLAALQARADANAGVLFDWIERTPWIANLAADPATRSNTSVCMRFTQVEGGAAAERRIAERVASLLAEERIAYDIGAYRTAPPGLRIWCGATVERDDVAALPPWLEWAYAKALAGRD
ncbi:MAG: phosphoserine transaminase [Hyphomicrobium sp.]|jgi:phosphoserine aminotransferase